MCAPEDQRQQTLVGVFGMIPARAAHRFSKLCLWTRWCGGARQFVEKSLILGCDDEQPITQSELRFSLPDLDSYVTNVHVLGGVQFQRHGVYRIEIRLDAASCGYAFRCRWSASSPAASELTRGVQQSSKGQDSPRRPEE